MEQEQHFEALEEHVRKNWLISFAITGGLALLSSIFFEKMITLMIVAIQFVVTYHCAYRKKGTAWLAWLLFWYPVSFLWLLVDGWKDYGRDEPQGFMIVWLLIAIIDAYFLWNCWQLRKINKQAPKHDDPEYFESIMDLKNSTSLKELNAKFSSLIKKWPAFESTSSMEYKSKKSQFLIKRKK